MIPSTSAVGRPSAKDLKNPEPIPVGTDHCLVVTSDVPIVVRHTRLDSRQEANALMSTIAYPA
ncbi:sensory rhodopsin transducer [Actinomadura keratinilytica]|uniref:sensory rhodopsin transducer n=1 Tax=Actinomadura keratinilytica TaxID=547461 RepID=UPI00361D5A08